MNKWVLLLFLMFPVLPCIAQSEYVIRGTVTDGSNGKPMPGVTVSNKEFSTNGVSTDAEGRFF